MAENNLGYAQGPYKGDFALSRATATLLSVPLGWISPWKGQGGKHGAVLPEDEPTARCASPQSISTFIFPFPSCSSHVQSAALEPSGVPWSPWGDGEGAAQLWEPLLELGSNLCCSFSLLNSPQSPGRSGESFQLGRNFPPKHFPDLKSLHIFPAENIISIEGAFSLSN